ncbi:MAG TPA: hypothetical protein VN851_16250 [Thermoanaerobaculia bacterium]|nr:hypothetical protein [Thermoanaerobaculia bacterium]
MSDLEVSPAVLAAHADLSSAARLYVEALEHRPDWLRPVDFPTAATAEVPDWALRLMYPLQSWPTYIDAAKVREIETATAAVTSLVEQVPARIFDGDAERVARYFNESPARTALLLEPPDLSSTMASRVDFVISEPGIQCLEVNLSARLGGWELRFWESFCRNRPGLAELLAGHGIAPRYSDPLRALFAHLIRNAVASGLAGNGEVNLALLMAPNELDVVSPAALAYLRGLFRELLEEQEPGLGGSVAVGAFPDSFEIRRGKLYLKNGKRVHALYEFGTAWVPIDVYLFGKTGQLQVYNGPVQRFGGDKRCLALLSQHAAGGRFDARERELIERYVPWGREWIAGPVEYQGERHDLAALLRGKRERFVLKKGWSFEGRDVAVGRFTPQAEWERLLDETLAAGGWLAQEWVESRPYLYQHGERGAALHSVIWGTFCLGGRYGGGFLRMMPQGQGDGVINSKRGATEGYIFEV